MTDKELLQLWQSTDHKLEKMIKINKQIIGEVTALKINRSLGRMRMPKSIFILIGIPYTFLLWFICMITFLADSYIMASGFLIISLIMSYVVISYLLQLYQIGQIQSSRDIITVQQHLSQLRLSSFNCLKANVIQLPFWSICWISMNALKESPLIYGGSNVLIFSGLSYLSYWLYTNLSLDDPRSKVSQFFLSGIEWEPIEKAIQLAEELDEYRRL